MCVRLSELRIKEVIGVNNGTRFGYVYDAELDETTGQVLGLIIPGRLRLFGLLGRERPMVIPWRAVQQFGEDTLLVNLERMDGEEGENTTQMESLQEK